MSLILRPSRRALAALVVLLALLLAVETVALAANLKRNGGAVTAVRTATDDSLAVTNSLSYSTVPGMSVTVPVPSGQKALLVITFSGRSQCTDDDGATVFCKVRVLVDGTSLVPPGEIIWDTPASGEAVKAQSMQWVAGPVSSGSHTVRVEYLVDEPNSGFIFVNRTLTVLRSKV